MTAPDTEAALALVVVFLGALTALSLVIYGRASDTLNAVKAESSPAAVRARHDEIDNILRRLNCDTRAAVVLVLHDIAPTVPIHVSASDGCEAINAGP